MSQATKAEGWSSRLGIILAVSGSAVGLGNFLRFPGQAAKYGGGAFMIAYFTSLLVLGMSICWAEWTLGRWGGRNGFHSSPGIFGKIIGKPWGKYLGVLGVVVPVGIYMYYVYIEAWCFGYSMNFLTGNLGGPHTANPHFYSDFFAQFTGANQDGFAIGFHWSQVGLFVIAVYILNFFFIYRGISRGIEMFCKVAMPALILLAIVILVRVLTLGAPVTGKPDQNVLAGLGFMWNPGDIGKQLLNPQLWLAAAGQIFFTLSVGFGVIITYASYLTEKDDVVLSGLTATAANEFCEVGLGGMITLPAGFVFLGAAGLAGQGTFQLGFNVLPEVFAHMPAGHLFGFLFFFLLFLAAITSSLSMLQPGIAFLEEGLGINRKQSVALLGLITVLGSMFVWYNSKDLKALDTIDFWVGTFLIFIQGSVLIILFGWVMGIDRGFKEAHLGAELRIPNIFRVLMKYVCPLYLGTIFVLWILFNVIGWNGQFSHPKFVPSHYINDLLGTGGAAPSPVARITVLLIIAFIGFMMILVNLSGKRWNNNEKSPEVKS